MHTVRTGLSGAPCRILRGIVQNVVIGLGRSIIYIYIYIYFIYIYIYIYRHDVQREREREREGDREREGERELGMFRVAHLYMWGLSGDSLSNYSECWRVASCVERPVISEKASRLRVTDR